MPAACLPPGTGGTRPPLAASAVTAASRAARMIGQASAALATTCRAGWHAGVAQLCRSSFASCAASSPQAAWQLQGWHSRQQCALTLRSSAAVMSLMAGSELATSTTCKAGEAGRRSGVWQVPCNDARVAQRSVSTSDGVPLAPLHPSAAARVQTAACPALRRRPHCPQTS